MFKTIEDFHAELFSGEFKNKYIFCHFAEFDLNVIFGNIIKQVDNEAIFSGSNFIMAKREGVVFCDSLNIYKTSVKKIGEMMGIPKLEMDSGFGSGKRFEITQEHMLYCMRDCEIVWLALEKIFLEVQSVRPTLASLSLIYFRRFFQKSHIAYNEMSVRFFESYYGGRVEAFKLGKTDSNKYDINSMYPYAMVEAVFPNPKFVRVSASKDVKGLLHDMKHYEGQATIILKHKAINFGYLPVKRDGKLTFPVGRFSGTWCFPEIRNALNDGVIEITEVKEVLISLRMETPFKEFITTLYNSRLKVEGIEKTIKKLLMNANYGKWAQRQKHKEIYFDYFPFDIMEELKRLKIPYDLKVFNQVRTDCYLVIYNPVKVEKLNRGFKLTYDNGTEIELNDYSIYTKRELSNMDNSPKIHTIPVFSSYITSVARVHLLQNMLKYKHCNITYVDTDSIAMERKPKIVDSMKLGEFKKEKELMKEIFGNKNYTQEVDGKLERKIKGIPGKAVLIGENKYEFENFIKTKRAIRHMKNAGTIETFTKQLTNKYDKRTAGKKNGRTKPLKYKLEK